MSTRESTWTSRQACAAAAAMTGLPPGDVRGFVLLVDDGTEEGKLLTNGEPVVALSYLVGILPLLLRHVLLGGDDE
jgi:hypothetical protein